MGTAISKGNYSIDDILWDHCSYNKELITLFKKYQKKIEECNRARYDKATQRIILNTICIIINKCEINDIEIFFDDFNESLSMALVFADTDLQKHRKEIYEVIPKIQNLAIIHEGRDFRWNVLCDRHLNKDLLESEYSNVLKVVDD